jgi:hypothetical protein
MFTESCKLDKSHFSYQYHYDNAQQHFYYVYDKYRDVLQYRYQPNICHHCSASHFYRNSQLDFDIVLDFNKRGDPNCQHDDYIDFNSTSGHSNCDSSSRNCNLASRNCHNLGDGYTGFRVYLNFYKVGISPFSYSALRNQILQGLCSFCCTFSARTTFVHSSKMPFMHGG